MKKCPPRSARSRRNGGFALIVVLWTLVLIAFIVAHLTSTGRTEVRIASNFVANAVAQAAADGAIFETIFNLSDPAPAQRWPVDGTVHEIVIGNSRVQVRLEDEAWWINPSTASPVLIEALLRVTGSDPESAQRLAAAISEWVGSGGMGGLASSGATPRQQNALLAEYSAAGLDYSPPVGNGIERLSNRTNTFAPSTRSSPGHPSEESLGRWISYSAAEMRNALTFQNTKRTRQDVRFFEKVQYATILFKRSKTEYDHRGVTIVATASHDSVCPVAVLQSLMERDPQPVRPAFSAQKRCLHTRRSHQRIRKQTPDQGNLTGRLSRPQFPEGQPRRLTNKGLTQEEIQTLGR